MSIPEAAGEERQRLYERLFVAAEDLGLARQYAQHLLKKGWHSAPWERRGSIYMQQSAFVTALVVSYARAFTKSYGWPKFPESFLPEDQGATALHKRLIALRHEVYAHSDSKHHKVQPWRIGSKVLTDLRGAPFWRFTKDECGLITELIDGILKRVSPKLAVMRAEIADI
ncbi:MAG: hypothetical protein ACN6Q5_10455 [Pseudomonas sp.]|uniref:hypothetical protein n=1 Tax=Pseudomonas sp. TaxID=306 RepID=UPI003D0D971A